MQAMSHLDRSILAEVWQDEAGENDHLSDTQKMNEAAYTVANVYQSKNYL